MHPLSFCLFGLLLKYCDFSLQILDRKNDEIEALKSLYKNKQNEAEETIRKLEKKGDFYIHGWFFLLGGTVLHPSCGCGLMCSVQVQMFLPSSFAGLDLLFAFRFLEACPVVFAVQFPNQIFQEAVGSCYI